MSEETKEGMNWAMRLVISILLTITGFYLLQTVSKLNDAILQLNKISNNQSAILKDISHLSKDVKENRDYIIENSKAIRINTDEIKKNFYETNDEIKSGDRINRKLINEKKDK